MRSWTMLMIVAIIIFVVVPSFKDRIMPVKKLLITPVIFTYLFYGTINENFAITNWVIAIGMMTGVTIGILIRNKTIIKSDKNKSLIQLPGSYLSLILFSSLFIIHFIIGYLQSVNPSYLTHANAGEQIVLFLLACLSSISIGGNVTLYWKYLLSESSHLTYASIAA